MNTTSINKTYVHLNKTNNQVIFDHTTFLKSKFNSEVDGEKKKFTNIYLKPKP